VIHRRLKGADVPTATTLNIVLNGTAVTAAVADATEPLLFVLRNQLDQLGPKFGCGIAQCGACTVLVNGNVVRSCVTQVATIAAGSEVSTLDGLSKLPPRRPGPNGVLHPLQSAFIGEQAAQCGFCMNGLIMGSLAWLNKRFASGNRGVPSDDEIKQYLSGKSADSALNYLCRCGAHLRVIRAVQKAAEEMAT
jgi:nicotinate dehydrogenase subunit A